MTGNATLRVGAAGRERLLAYLALAVSVLGTGSAVIFIRLSEVDPTATLMLRMFVASVIISAMAVPRPGRHAQRCDRIRRISRRDAAVLVLSSALAGLDLFANHWAATLTSVVSTVLLANLTPVFVVLLTYLMRERVSRGQVAAVLLAVAGAGLLMLANSSAPSAPDTHLTGDLLSLLSAAVYAVCLIMTKGLVARVPTTLVMLANAFVTGALLAPLAMATSPAVFPRTPQGYALILGYALVSQLIGHGLLTYALRTVDAALASISALLRPVVSIVLSWLILGETLHSSQALGGAVILAALAWFQFGATPGHSPAPGSQVDTGASGRDKRDLRPEPRIELSPQEGTKQ